jgi:hypothetical protein
MIGRDVPFREQKIPRLEIDQENAQYFNLFILKNTYQLLGITLKNH